jgi:hypothetical protein
MRRWPCALAKEKMALQGMIYRCKCYRMEINVEETTVMASKELLLVQLTIDQI